MLLLVHPRFISTTNVREGFVLPTKAIGLKNTREEVHHLDEFGAVLGDEENIVAPHDVSEEIMRANQAIQVLIIRDVNAKATFHPTRNEGAR